MEFILTVLKSLGYRKARKQQLFYYELICIFFCLSVEQYFFFFVLLSMFFHVACGFHVDYQPYADFLGCYS